MLIANYAGYIADSLFALNGGGLSTASAWLGALAYTLQIFFDFSGYSDMAIGLGRMFGFHFLENFNYPYIAKSVSEFWRRWHISLTSWFRDYVYIPLGGNRVSKARLYRNLLVVWLLTGIWHGANWTFILWGLFYFVLIASERLLGLGAKTVGSGKTLPPLLAHFYTLFLVVMGWVLFRAENLSLAASYYRSLFSASSNPIVDETFWYYLRNGATVLLAGIGLSMPLVPWLKGKLNRKCKGNLQTAKAYTFIRAIGTLILFVLSILVCVKSEYNPFIYFNF
jgi:D-alanyl-lipoteichoic acid acyltransferase DltB (MBOAT superfamily)